jgi:ATP-dependent protease Clp ATPase subunit
MNRRNFLALIGASVPGLWLNGVGLIQLPRKMVISLSGHCSFCGKEAKSVFGLAGVIGRPTRICNECIDICFEILLDDIQMMLVPPYPDEQTEEAGSAISIDFEPEGLIRNVKVPQTRAELNAFTDQLRRLLDQTEKNQEPRKRSAEPSCSFCDLEQSKVKKLIAGPQTYICESCIGDAAALINMHS